MIYLIHFQSPISNNHTTQHYIGYSKNPDNRLQDHKSGNGARLTQVANERGIEYEIVRTWEGDRKRERQIKNWKMGPKLCPICNEGG